MDVLHWIELGLLPISNVITWLSSSRKRRNDSINSLQDTVNMLVNENKKLYDELAATRFELAEARKEIALLKSAQNTFIAKMKREEKKRKTTKKEN